MAMAKRIFGIAITIGALLVAVDGYSAPRGKPPSIEPAVLVDSLDQSIGPFIGGLTAVYRSSDYGTIFLYVHSPVEERFNWQVYSPFNVYYESTDCSGTGFVLGSHSNPVMGYSDYFAGSEPIFVGGEIQGVRPAGLIRVDYSSLRIFYSQSYVGMGTPGVCDPLQSSIMEGWATEWLADFPFSPPFRIR